MSLAAVRTTDPHTSHAAAQSLSGEYLRGSQADVLTQLRDCGPSTAEFLTETINLDRRFEGMKPRSGSRIRTAIRELVNAGLVRDSGRTSQTASDYKAILWEVA